MNTSQNNSMTENEIPQTIARVGHVNLKVSDIKKSLSFYEDILGMRVTKLIHEQAAFLSYGGYHHDLCINTWFSRNGQQPAKGTTGLYHVAIVYENREALLDAYARLKAKRVEIDAIVDHGVTQSIYLRDPDENGIELYWDRPAAEWFDANGRLAMGHKPITEADLLAP